MRKSDRAVGYVGYVSSFQLALKIEGLRPHTVSCYVREANRLGEHCGWPLIHDLKSSDVRSYLDALGKTVVPKTVTEAQLGLRRFFRFLVAEGEIGSDPSRNIPLTRFRVDPQPTYTPGEVSQLLAACNEATRLGVREKALVTVCFDTGVRVGELVSMGMPDWDARTVVVDGKTGIRTIPLGDSALLATHRYVRRWGVQGGKLWRGEKGPLTTSGVFQLVRRLCRRAGVEDKGVHAFRRAAAAQMKRLGMNDSDILQVMGWKDVTMLRRYTAAVADELAQAAHLRFSPSDSLGESH
jgi:site-specific recombinase XerD